LEITRDYFLHWIALSGQSRRERLERERDQKPTNLVASRANREDKEAGGQGLSLCSFHHCREVTSGLARPCYPAAAMDEA